MIAPTPIPTPMPTLAPVERLGSGALVEEADGLDEAGEEEVVEPAAAVLGAGLPVDVAAVLEAVESESLEGLAEV